MRLSHISCERAIILLGKFHIQANPPVPLFRYFTNFLANYLHFAFQNGFHVSFFFFNGLDSLLSGPVLNSLFPQIVFDLVSTNAAGIAHPLPAELGPLPLFQDEDGFYSVLGPSPCHTPREDHVDRPTNHTLANNPINIPGTITPPKDKVFCGSSRCSGNRFAPSTPLYAYPSHKLTLRSGPHTCSRSSYTCNVPNCDQPRPFKTRQALNRHYEAVHLAERFDCPVPQCENVGEKGIKRYDNLVAHMRNKHRM